MKVISRSEFTDLFNGKHNGLGDIDSPLWMLEQGFKCKYFVCRNPLLFSGSAKIDYWVWVEQNAVGKVLCFSSTGTHQEANSEEWWGFH